VVVTVAVVRLWRLAVEISEFTDDVDVAAVELSVTHVEATVAAVDLEISVEVAVATVETSGRADTVADAALVLLE